MSYRRPRFYALGYFEKWRSYLTTDWNCTQRPLLVASFQCLWHLFCKSPGRQATSLTWLASRLSLRQSGATTNHCFNIDCIHSDVIKGRVKQYAQQIFWWPNVILTIYTGHLPWMKISALIVGKDRSFRRPYCLHRQRDGITLRRALKWFGTKQLIN